MSRYRLTPRARADLGEIWDYSVARFGAEQAEAYLRQIADAMARVAADPMRGRACDDIRAGYLKYPVSAHLLFYRPTEGGVDIVRILHQRMDFERHL